ncbi:MAG: hypothetical protein IPG58_04830 [Acidobacteria bacterium]|nr:hypothetical protein [Acidobacteriota bacterium]MBP7476729.1 hypothetical protein [Pyrinomonadaceae bacterium]
MKFRLVIAILAMSIGVFGQATPKMSAAEKEIRAFFDGYAEDLRQHRTEAIADRYDRRGTYLLGNGGKELVSFEDNKRYYTTKWKGPKSFVWKDFSFEIISKTAVVAIGKFEWQGEKDVAPATCSYSGLLIKTSGKWRIRVEDESCPPPK